MNGNEIAFDQLTTHALAFAVGIWVGGAQSFNLAEHGPLNRFFAWLRKPTKTQKAKIEQLEKQEIARHLADDPPRFEDPGLYSYWGYRITRLAPGMIMQEIETAEEWDLVFGAKIDRAIREVRLH
jgi:hypothetical protein